MVRNLLRKTPAVLFVLLSLFFTPYALSADTLSPAERLRIIENGSRLDYVSAPKNLLTLKDLQSSESRLNWRKSIDKNINLGYRDSPFWYRFQLENPGKVPVRFYLQQNYPLADQLRVYIIENDVLKQTFETGDHFPFASRPVEGRSFAFPIEASAGARLKIFIFMKNNGPQRAAFKFILPETFKKVTNIEAMFLWLYYGLMLGMIFYNLLIYLSIRNPAYLYYVFFISALVIFTLAENGMGFQYFWSDYPFIQNMLLFINICLLSFAALKFLIHFLELKKYSELAFTIVNFIARVTLGLTLLPILSEGSIFLLRTYTPLNPELNSAGLSGIFPYFLGIQLFIVPLTQITCLWVGFWLIKEKNRSAMYYVSSWLVVIISGLIMMLPAYGLLPAMAVTTWAIYLGSSAQVIILSLGLADRINGMRRELTDLNTHLEEKVDKRTERLRNTIVNTEALNRKLEDSLTEAQKLHEKQNEDYFLTSLLTDPLTENLNDSKIVRTSFALEQYKKFNFRRRDSEIGGDLCLTDTIERGDKRWVVFVNGDAMGKSIQGAGGILLLGASLKAFLAQAKKNSYTYDLPELWLRDIYTSLQNLFTPFDGSMMVSLAMGLVDEETGFLYYINSEHPLSVLYRDGRADFLDEGVSQSRLGAPENEQMLHIKTYQLTPGDIVICGSDGRDEFLTGTEGRESMNRDRDLFLRLVEEKQGNVNNMLETIKSRGGLLDDCSLLQLEYLPDSINESRFTPEPFWQEIYNLYKQKNYTGTVRRIRSAYSARSAPTRVLFLWFNSLFKLNRYQRAALIGRLYLIQNPGDEAAMYLMARLLLKGGRRTETMSFLEALQLRHPENKRYKLALVGLIKKKRNTTRKQRSNRRNYPATGRLLQQDRAQPVAGKPLTKNSAYG